MSSTFFGISTLSYIAAMAIYISYLAFKKKGIGIFATSVTVFGFINQTIALLLRWSESYRLGIGRAPLTNLYESLIFFVWTLILIYLIIEFKYKTHVFGAFVTPIAGLALAFIELSGMSKNIEPLVPALQSNWLIAHVMISFLGYAAFGVSFATGLMYLILRSDNRRQGIYIFWTICVSIFIIILAAFGIDYIHYKAVSSGQEMIIKEHLFESTFKNLSLAIDTVSWLVSAGLIFILWRYGLALKRLLHSFSLSVEILDEITYKTIAIGFPLLTLGVITGAVWANTAWGVYWSWDPKETWSLITWFIYAVYLHGRFVRGWRGKKVAVLSVLGFVAVIFTYLGVNLLLSGLHSYGSMK